MLFHWMFGVNLVIEVYNLYRQADQLNKFAPGSENEIAKSNSFSFVF